MGAQPQTFPIKTFPYSNAFTAKWLTQSLPFNCVTDKIYKQTTSNVYAPPAAWMSEAPYSAQ